MIIREYEEKDMTEMCRIWNEVVEEGIAFPQINTLDEEEGKAFFAEQNYCGVAEDAENGQILGLYILHPNNIGRCGHLANASFAVDGKMRGRHIGELLVTDCLIQAKKQGFGVLQFNAVVRTNGAARHLYEKLGFVELGTVPNGFLKKDGKYEDIVLYYHTL